VGSRGAGHVGVMEILPEVPVTVNVLYIHKHTALHFSLNNLQQEHI